MKNNNILKKSDNFMDTDTASTLRFLGINSESFDIMRDDLSVHLWIHDENNIIVYGNQSFTKNFGPCLKQKCHQCLMGGKTSCRCCLSKISMKNEKPACCELCKRRNSRYDINIIHTPITDTDGHKFILHSSLHIKDLSILATKLSPQQQSKDEEKKNLIMQAACKKTRDENNGVTIDNFISSMTSRNV